VYHFTPPTTTYRAGTDSLWGKVSNNRGLAVVLYDTGRIDTLSVAPSAGDDGITSVWPGGRTYTISDADAALLTAAGYSANLEVIA
jgi:hypothetical protein